MEILEKEILDCRKCDLCKTRNKPLIGDGSVDSEIVFVGESPGYNEDLTGKAFMGESGKILDQLLNSINLKRDQIYITNVLKCHPPKDRPPNRSEIEACIGYLHKQINIIKPKFIITLGKYASKEIFTRFNLNFTRISELHGKVFEAKTDFGQVNIAPMYHPAVACYHNEMIAVLKNDFSGLKERIQEINTSKE